MACDDRTCFGHDLCVRNAFTRRNIGNASTCLANILFDKIKTKSEYIVQQILRLASAFARQSRQPAFVGGSKCNCECHDATLKLQELQL